MVNKFYYLLAVSLGFAAGATLRALPARHPAAATRQEPTLRDIAAASRGEVLVRAEEREEEIQLAYIEAIKVRPKANLIGGDYDAAGAAARLDKLLGEKSALTFRVRKVFEGSVLDMAVRIRRDSEHPAGFSVKEVYSDYRPDGWNYWGRTGVGCSMLDFYYKEARGALLVSPHGADYAGRYRYQRLQMELPLRDEAKVPGRLLAWDGDRQDITVIGSITWERLEEHEWKAYQRAWQAEFDAHPGRVGVPACREGVAWGVYLDDF